MKLSSWTWAPCALVVLGCGAPTSTAPTPAAPPTASTFVGPVTSPPADKAERYSERVAATDRRREELKREYEAASGPDERLRTLGRTRQVLEQAIVTELVPPWLGTPWAFSGTSQSPGKGSIACGYFVSTLLRDAGFRVPRVAMAQQASERIIKSMTVERYIRRFSDVPLSTFLRKVRAFGEGLYIVGLDFHVGLLWVGPGETRFLHSSNVGCLSRPQGCVLDERADSSLALEHSRYRVVGHLSADPAVLRGWLKGTSFSLK